MYEIIGYAVCAIILLASAATLILSLHGNYLTGGGTLYLWICGVIVVMCFTTILIKDFTTPEPDKITNYELVCEDIAKLSDEEFRLKHKLSKSAHDDMLEIVGGQCKSMLGMRK